MSEQAERLKDECEYLHTSVIYRKGLQRLYFTVTPQPFEVQSCIGSFFIFYYVESIPTFLLYCLVFFHCLCLIKKVTKIENMSNKIVAEKQ